MVDWDVEAMARDVAIGGVTIEEAAAALYWLAEGGISVEDARESIRRAMAKLGKRP